MSDQTGRYSRRPTGGDPFGGKFHNGKIPQAALRRVESSPRFYLAPIPALCADYMAAAAERDGIPLSLVAGYRDYAGQVAAKKHWTSVGKPEFAATPGTSNHGFGTASDWSTADPRVVPWLDAHGAEYGWDSPLWAEDGRTPDEGWHRQFIQGFKPENCPTRPIRFLINGKSIDAQGAYFDVQEARTWGPLEAVREALSLHYGPPQGNRVAVRRGNDIRRLVAEVRGARTWARLGDLHQFPGVVLDWVGAANLLRITAPPVKE